MQTCQHIAAGQSLSKLSPQLTFPKYDRTMARGWESKSVEEQMAMHEKHPASQGAKHKALGELAKKRDLQALELQRERILSERTSSPHRRAALQAALSDIEAKLTSLN